MGHHGTVGNAITWIDGGWVDGNPPILGPLHHAVWLASVVFDGARAVRGMAPDLDRHCARVVRSAEILGLAPTLGAEPIAELAWDGIARFPGDAELYIKPLFYAESGLVIPDPDSTRFAMTVAVSPLPDPGGFSACRSSFRRPARDMAPTDAKAACLYPNVARAVAEARSKGFDQPIVLDPSGNVAEFGYMNLMMAIDGVVHTPAANGTFLNGITRQRVIALLRDDGIEVVERAIGFSELLAADEVFATGNYAKVTPCARIDGRELAEGPIARRARDLYWDFAATAVRTP